MRQCLFIPGRLPGLNEIIDMRGKRRGKWDPYNEMKKSLTNEIGLLAKMAKFKPFSQAHFTFHHYEKDRRRDPDNFCGGVQKIVLDALVEAGLMPGDGWTHVLSIRHHWEVRKEKDGVAVVAQYP